MTREEWFEKAEYLLGWVHAYVCPARNKQAERDFLAHIKTPCPEDVLVDIEGAEFFTPPNPVWLGAVIYNDNEKGEEK